MHLSDFDNLITNLLNLDLYNKYDYTINGIQVERQNKEIKKVAFSVDACLTSFKNTAEQKADMIFVHHGLFWKKMWPLSFTGTMYNRISYLIQNDLALYAVHLPLDVHPELGNNAQICNKLGLVDIQPFGYYKGLAYGYKGRLTKTTKRDDIIPLICSQPEECQKILPFGRPEINTVGVVSGGMADAVREAITSGLDLFITGTAEHQVYHECLENNINVIFGGHYLTEIWGVKAVANYLKTNTDLETIFLDIPTGL